MASLYERLLGVHPTRPKIPVHQFQSAAAEWARGKITGAQANAIITAVSGVGLDATEQLEAQDLVATVTSIAIPTGTTTALIAARAEALANRALKIQEIDQVLLLADSRVAPYNDAGFVRTRLGVQTR